MQTSHWRRGKDSALIGDDIWIVCHWDRPQIIVRMDLVTPRCPHSDRQEKEQKRDFFHWENLQD